MNYGDSFPRYWFFTPLFTLQVPKKHPHMVRVSFSITTQCRWVAKFVCRPFYCQL